MRVVNLGTVSVPRSLAVFHAVAQEAAPSDEMTLVFARPAEAFVSVGYHQLASRELNVPYCRSHNIPIARRLVGGGAVLLDHNQVFWHLIMPGAHASVKDLYQALLPAPVAAYQRMGINAAIRPLNDIVVGSRKIGGTGAATIAHSLIFVGSLMYDFDRELMAHVLNVPSEKFRDKTVQAMRDYMTTMTEQLPQGVPSAEEAIDILSQEFANMLDTPAHYEDLRENEEEAAKQFAVQLFDPDFVFQNEGWTVPGTKITGDVYLYEGLYKAPTGLVRAIWREREGLIESAWLGGDFLIEPAQALQALQDAINQASLSVQDLPDFVERLFREGKVKGIAADDIVQAFLHRANLEEAAMAEGGTQRGA
ncbi:MAG: lipoate--protein ligase family protein [Sulfobacillus thermosulfidooxidans]|uniref:BPL/LPL catalytic domain-containing protein n=1 Tax=Sulfobacillus thermotolerans TaxID=338644 RepID=A0ABN5GWQ4_9FIRM|nr:biotin/lipoate A/B protein ligase family protein [Sulfobacillus sp. hq2]AUW92765.1 hypothetical protein BXT84_01345 [Sulfobacillus thermotolerans]MCY0909346.1 biotin/lipoate A/B protein ligase family protein [Sulfobacillus thermotolerans]POB12005.1 ligase [Sulfobacillus sp. hq2]PSR36420.1 MAG: lipoate--protein ligase family protein [Sulfobacillus thermosulfidooxidans]